MDTRSTRTLLLPQRGAYTVIRAAQTVVLLTYFKAVG